MVIFHSISYYFSLNSDSFDLMLVIETVAVGKIPQGAVEGAALSLIVGWTDNSGKTVDKFNRARRGWRVVDSRGCRLYMRHCLVIGIALTTHPSNTHPQPKDFTIL